VTAFLAHETRSDSQALRFAFTHFVVTLFFIATTFLVGAARATEKSVSSEESNKLAQGTDGFLVISLGSRYPILAENLYFRLREVVSRKEYSILYNGRSRSDEQPHDFVQGSINASVYVLRLPPGKYEFYRFTLKQQTLVRTRPGSRLDWQTMGTVTSGPKEEFSVPFVIEYGKVTYVAQFMQSVIYQRSAIASNSPGFSYFVVSNQQSRDLATAYKRGEVSSDLPVLSAIPDLIAINSPVLRGALVTDAEMAIR
jgi:hypothetical protein